MGSPRLWSPGSPELTCGFAPYAEPHSLSDLDIEVRKCCLWTPHPLGLPGLIIPVSRVTYFPLNVLNLTSAGPVVLCSAA